MNNNGNERKPKPRVVRMAPPAEQQLQEQEALKQKKQKIKPHKKQKKSKDDVKDASKAKTKTKTVARGIGKSVMVIFLICLITLCIVGTAMTVFVMNYVNSDSTIDLNNINLGYSSTIYAKNTAGEDVVVRNIATSGKREWIDYDEIPQFVIDAFVYTEDERFFDHEGVDWLRSVAAFINMIPGINISSGGGSTITQQLIKNINQDFYNRTPAVKAKEILGALNLEKNYTKEQILQAYLNCISMGNGTYGVKAAAKQYFGKDVKDLSLAQAASLACITKSPDTYNPVDGPEKNAERRKYTLSKMREFDRITEEEYNKAVAEEITVVDQNKSDDGNEQSKYYNWYEEAVIMQVRDDLVKQFYLKKYTSSSYEDALNSEQGSKDAEALKKARTDAMTKINTGGIQIYTPMDIQMQDQLEANFLNDKLFSAKKLKQAPEGAMVIMDYDGYIKALVGSRYPKESNLVKNRATMDPRSPGSTIKPIADYAPALESNTINYSMTFIDSPTEDIRGTGEINWPKNYDKRWSNSPVTVADGIKDSKNTVAVQVMQTLSPKKCFDFLTQQLGFTTLVENSQDTDRTLALGMLKNGLLLDELTASYTMFGNGGYFSPAKVYVKVVDSSGDTLLEADASKTQVISSDTAYIMNKLLAKVVDEGTGKLAKINNMSVVGKTGTSDDIKELSFVGCTPYYVAGIRFAYDQKKENADKNLEGTGYKPQQVWSSIMSQFHKGVADKPFDVDSKGVKTEQYCQETGLLAGPNCPDKKTGYYRKGNVPAKCSSSHSGSTPEE